MGNDMGMKNGTSSGLSFERPSRREESAIWILKTQNYEDGV